ncbi:MAG: SRPBCC family protein [Xanthomonadaceae bacterium]|nr:SRPBCC family protein [Xanthomonadaceae bacterium]
MSNHGTLTAPDTIRFERLLPGPIERVWDFLVDPDKRARWLAGGPMSLTPGGDVELQFHNAELSQGDDPAPEKYRDYENSGEVFGQVTACEPPRLLAFTWSDMPGEPEAEDSEVRFELETQGEQVLLTLTHTRLMSNELLSVAGGWHTHLGILEDILSNKDARPFWRTHTRLEAEYADRLEIEV